MVNDVYEHAVVAFTPLLGKASPLASGTGVRFVNAAKGKATVYHDAVAAGNRVEVAFELDSFAKRIGKTHSQARTLLQELRSQTGRGVDVNSQHNWPRVGFSTRQQVDAVVAILLQLSSK